MRETERRPDQASLDGILVVDKPAGPTSHDVVALVRRLSLTRRIGHGGTLDPFATGVLPLFLGSATRLVEYHLGDSKAYRATICFGARSTTDDLEGELAPDERPAPMRVTVEAALEAFRGTISQLPPTYSAVKLNGRRSYQLARSGEAPELKPRTVTIHRLELTDWNDEDPDRPLAVVEVECSAGTYVRALARDLGSALGNAAYLGGLVRTASGSFRLRDAVPLDALRRAAKDGPAGIAPLLRPIDAGLERLPRLVLAEPEVASVRRGQFVRPSAGTRPEMVDQPVLALDVDGRIVAVGHIRDGRFAPDKVLVRHLNSDTGLADGPRRLVGVEAALAAERDARPSIDSGPAAPDDV